MSNHELKTFELYMFKVKRETKTVLTATTLEILLNQLLDIFIGFLLLAPMATFVVEQFLINA